MRSEETDQPTPERISRLMPNTDAPLFHALNLLATGDAARFHMPGHKGEPVFSTFSDVFAIDFTETYDTGNLYTGSGPIRDAEIAAARYYHADDCFFLTGGSTQGVLAMLATAVPRGGSVLLDRGCHQSVCHGLALLGLTPYFVTPPLLEPYAIAGGLPIAEAERTLRDHPEISAVLITSPTYYGVQRDVEGFSELCRKYGKLLLVDAAHGAHFPAVGLHVPTEQGADMAVLSMHKTLPCLGQGAVLLSHASVDRGALRENTALFGTSSPSYPIMASIDLARAYMEGTGRTGFRRAAETCASLRRLVDLHTRFRALSAEDCAQLDPCRLTVCTAGSELTGHELSDRLWSQFGVACEMADEYNAVFIITCSDSGTSLRRLRRALRTISRRCANTIFPVTPPPELPEAERVMSVREAWFAPIGRIDPSAAAGMVCARPVTPYPPGVPLIYPGEKITPAHIELLQQRWYNTCKEICVVIPQSPAERGTDL